MKTLSRLAFAAAILTSAAAPAVGGELKLTISNGRVTMEAKDVTVREILAEWARVGRTVIVNGDKLTGPPVTLQFTDVPEAQALDSLLRSAAGYVMAPRAVAASGPSVYDRIMILASSRPPAFTASAGSAAPPITRPFPQMQMGSPDDDQEVGMTGNANLFMNGNTGMMPGPAGVPQTAPAQQGPLTASRPGMLPAPPAAPAAAPGTFNQTPAPNPNSPFYPTPASPYQGTQPGVATPVYTPMPTPPPTRPGNPTTPTGRGGGG